MNYPLAVLSLGAFPPDRNSQNQEREKRFQLLVSLKERRETILKVEKRKHKIGPMLERLLSLFVSTF